MRVVSELRLQWDVIGVRVPVTLRRGVIVLSPSMIMLGGPASARVRSAHLRPAFAMRLFARTGDVEVYEDSLRLSVEWGLTAQAEARSEA